LYLQLDDYGLVKFTPLDQSDEESISDCLLQIDLAIQYGEDLEPKDPVSHALFSYSNPKALSS